MTLSPRTRREAISLLIALHGNKCVQCSNPWKTIDHITPKGLGGTDDTSNLQLLCKKCHNKKTEQDLKDIIKHRHKLKKQNHGLAYYSRLYRHSIAWKPKQTRTFTMPYNPFLRGIEFHIGVSYVTLQMPPITHPYFENRFAQVFLNNKPAKKDTPIRIKRKDQPLTIKVKWGSMTDRALINPAYVTSAELFFLVYENRLTDELLTVKLQPWHSL